MKKVFLALLSLIIQLNTADASNLLFRPLTGNIFEPRVGAVIDFQEENLRLDIGTSIDLFTLHKTDSSEIRLGGDFFTYTRLRSEGRFKFPVETSDYFFGANVSGKSYLYSLPIEWRVRLSHISSHLVDGYAKDSTFMKMPFVYSREFVDAVVATYLNEIRVYAGLMWIFSMQPKDVSKIVPQFGLDGEIKLHKNLYASFGYDFKIFSVNNHSALTSGGQFGVLLKSSMNTAVGLYLYNYNGWSMHGMFYDEKISNFGGGFQLIF